MRRLIIPVLLCSLAAACGKKGPPVPPVPVIPRSVSDLTVMQRGKNVVLSWAYPSLSTSGVNLGTIRRILVYRVREELPASLSGQDPKLTGEVNPDAPIEPALFSRVPLLTAQQFVKLRDRIDAIAGADLPGYTAGGKILYTDVVEMRTTDDRPVRYTYAVVTEGEAARSDLSNLITIVPVEVPPPPTGLAANSEPEGVHLTWQAPSGTEATFAGYNIYRFPPIGDIAELGVPVNSQPVRETTFRDTPPLGSYRYKVTAVAAAGPPRIESDATQSVLVEFVDLVPPPVPAGLSVLSESDAVRLLWEAVSSPDLAGYRIFRTEGSERKLLTPALLTETLYRDDTIVRGTRYIYSVTSVDRKGNESAPASSEPVLVAK